MFDADLSLVPAHQRILVAASGGADSMALIVWLLSEQRNVVVGHVNHALDELRGGACARDEAWLRLRCDELGVPLQSETIVLERRDGHVNEAVARTGRYAALQRLALANDCALVATAHTASDALEGLILNIGRGAGLRGQSSFASSRPLGDGLTLVRPLWRVGRQQVRDWLLSQNQTWLEDESNLSELFRRNRVRAEVVPLLSSIFGREADSLARSFALNAQLSRDEDSFLEREAQRTLEMLIVKRGEKLLALNGIALRDLDVALARRVLRLAARSVQPELREIERLKIETVRLAAVNGQKREVWTWRNGVRVEWTGAGSGNRFRFWCV
ncbi:tRNA lysidine(34) synthetase TilS [bacterium]|nr:MAG: tRNA lysidine(34) synthetase TilS [bacterium]